MVAEIYRANGMQVSRRIEQWFMWPFLFRGASGHVTAIAQVQQQDDGLDEEIEAD
jgi:hypothetical protein